MQFEMEIDSYEESCRKQEPNSIWFRVPLSLSHLLGSISKKGFKYHNAESEYAMLMKWIPTNRPCAVPPFATHQIGVGQSITGKLVMAEKTHLAMSVRLGGRDDVQFALDTGATYS